MEPNTSTSTKARQHLTEFQDLENKEGELYLRFYVASEREFALPATVVREVISAPLDRITPIPNAPYALLGTLNLRGRVIWVADLSYFLNEPNALNTERAEISVIAVEHQDIMVGLAVERIVGMEWLEVEEIQQNNSDSTATGFVRGEWMLDELSHKSIQLLDQQAIIQSGLWVA